jgi:hypothetical protein
VSTQVQIRSLLADEVTFSLSIEEEEDPVKGHFESDEPEKDKELEKEILSRLDRGDLWAWCCVKITASWNGLHGVTYLGCCSYESEEDFIKCNDYCQSMKDEALEELNKSLSSMLHQIAPLITQEQSA